MKYTQKEIDDKLNYYLDQLHEKELRKKELNEEIKQVKKAIDDIRSLNTNQTRIF